MRTRIKFCGCTSVADAQLAVAHGADAIGVILAAESPRHVSLHTAQAIAAAVPAFVSRVAVFVEPDAVDVAAVYAAGYTAQFSGSESAERCEAIAPGSYIKVYHVPPELSAVAAADEFALAANAYRRATWLFDTSVKGQYGGTGRTFDWPITRRLAPDRAIIISGGLNPENIGACVRAVRPYAVDVRSGIETGGVKDSTKMRAFVRAVREADEQT